MRKGILASCVVAMALLGACGDGKGGDKDESLAEEGGGAGKSSAGGGRFSDSKAMGGDRSTINSLSSTPTSQGGSSASGSFGSTNSTSDATTAGGTSTTGSGGASTEASAGGGSSSGGSDGAGGSLATGGASASEPQGGSGPSLGGSNNGGSNNGGSNNGGASSTTNLPPVFQITYFGVGDETPVGTPLGALLATDPEKQPVSYRIVSGNEGGLVVLAPSTGGITLNKTLDFDVQNRHVFQIEATDGVNTVAGVMALNVKRKFTDARDSKEYYKVKIGSQIWMAQGLNYVKIGNYSVCPNEVAGACSYMGRLYTWNMALAGSAASATNPSGVKGLCPDGFHLPSGLEWKQLFTWVTANALTASKGLALAEQSMIPHGSGVIEHGTDEFGFAAFFAGYSDFRTYDARWSHVLVMESGRFLATNERDATTYSDVAISAFLNSNLNSSLSKATTATSVRCVQD